MPKSKWCCYSKNNAHFISIKYDEYGVDKSFVYNKINDKGEKVIENLTPVETKERPYEPLVKVDSLDNIHLVWKENNHIYYTKLDDNGNKLIDKMTIV